MIDRADVILRTAHRRINAHTACTIVHARSGAGVNQQLRILTEQRDNGAVPVQEGTGEQLRFLDGAPLLLGRRASPRSRYAPVGGPNLVFSASASWATRCEVDPAARDSP